MFVLYNSNLAVRYTAQVELSVTLISSIAHIQQRRRSIMRRYA